MNSFGPSSLSNKKLEEQVLQIWDRLYTYITNTSTHKNPNRMLYSSSNQSFYLPNLLTYIQTNFGFHTNDLYRLIRDNLDLLRTIFDSIWSNTTLILTLVSTIISLLFTGGFALFNFFVSFIVFITLLFYLLSYSDQPIYQPTVWLNNALALGGSGLGKAVNDAITSVFIASLKIAAFYGLYTYVLHTLFGSNLVFIPAVIASICAVTLQSYWAALPGCLDLWLVQQRPLSAWILLIAQIIPVYVVDTTIYSEVKGGGHQVNLLRESVTRKTFQFENDSEIKPC
jgi:predicted PurR-regulated permease PerM